MGDMIGMDRFWRTVAELIFGIAFCGVVFEIFGIFFIEDLGTFSSGILLGTFVAAGSALHMAYNLKAALNGDGAHAMRSVRIGLLVRYVAITLVFILFVYFQIGNVLSFFLGVMSLKISAYMQPYVHKLWNGVLPIEKGDAQNGFYDSWSDKG